jgi:hypothetical protein
MHALQHLLHHCITHLGPQSLAEPGAVFFVHVHGHHVRHPIVAITREVRRPGLACGVERDAMQGHLAGCVLVVLVWWVLGLGGCRGGRGALDHTAAAAAADPMWLC